MHARMAWSSMVGAADWLADRLHGFALDVGSLVPAGLGACVRILHPAWREAPRTSVKVRWAELAHTVGVELVGTTRYEQVDQGRTAHVRPPDQGTLAPDELAALVEVLAGHTSRPDLCWFGVWDGYAWMTEDTSMALLDSTGGERLPASVVGLPEARVRLPGRTYALYRGGVGDANYLCREPWWQSPNVWWPDDRAWCVASDIDLRSTYVSGTTALADALLEDARIEVVRVSIDDPIAG